MAAGPYNPKSREEEKPKEPFDKAKEAGGHAVDKAKEAAACVGEMASQGVSALGKKADDLTATAGSDIRKMGDSLSQKAPHEGLLGHASQAVAETIKEGGHYLEEAKLSGMADDVTKLIRRNPMPAVLIGIGIGFILGRAMRD
jgi:ElaB/YqjD/DUF883 family membrane-anchored ribosome-binding protein